MKQQVYNHYTENWIQSDQNGIMSTSETQDEDLPLAPEIVISGPLAGTLEERRAVQADAIEKQNAGIRERLSFPGRPSRNPY